MQSIKIDKIQTKTASGDKKSFDFLNKEIRFGSVLSNKVKEAFFNDLSVLMNSGMNLKRSLELISADIKKKKIQQIYQNVHDALVEGASFNEGLAKTGAFDQYECMAVKIGEESGKLNLVLEYLKIYYAKKIEQRRQIISALTYPILVMMVAFGAVLFMIGFVVPTFADTFKKFKLELPWLTQQIIFLSNNFSWTILALVSFLVLVFSINNYFKKDLQFNLLKENILLKIPFFGKIYQLGIITQFTQTMQLLLSSKMPMVDSLKMIADMTKSYNLSKALNEIHPKIVQGEYLSEAMNNYQHIFPKRMIYMLKVGEEVNEINPMLGKLNHLYSEELDHNSKLLSSIIEPVLIIFLGLIVGTILVAMYLPMFSITNMLGN